MMITLKGLKVILWDGEGHMVFLIDMDQVKPLEDVVEKYNLPLPGFGLFQYGASAHIDHYQRTLPECNDILIKGDLVDIVVEFEKCKWLERIDMSAKSVSLTEKG